MTTAPAKTVLPHDDEKSVEPQFQRLTAEWERATAHLSSSAARRNHPAYQAILSLGVDVLPFLLSDLERNETHWFHALRTITGEDPVPANAAGDIPRMVKAWLDWARSRGVR